MGRDFIKDTLIMMEATFIPLRIHSDYSIIDGLKRPKAIVSLAKSLGYPALALTDMMNLSGWLQFSSAAYAAGIKPIAGADFLVHACSKICGRVTLLARSQEGYQALLALLTQACTAPVVSTTKQRSLPWELLSAYRDDLFFLSGGQEGLMTQLLQAQQAPQAREVLFKLTEAWRGSLFLEIQRAGAQWENSVNNALLALAQESQTYLVATHPVYFLHEEEFSPHQVRVAIQKGVQVGDKAMQSLQYCEGHYLQAAAAIVEKFQDIPQALQNSVEIAKRCNLFPQRPQPALPKLDSGTLSNEAYLKHLAEAGLQERLNTPALSPLQSSEHETYRSRLHYELEVIASMGFASYFLVVQEFIQWSKKQGIAVGPGRGSGAGSLVAYALGITEIDPIRFQLLFERFLNSARVSLPDFDIDFCPKERDKVIQHVVSLYGKDSVAQIATFGTMMARGVIRDVGRALGHSYGFADKIAKLVPFELGMTLEKALHSSPPLKTLCEEDEEVAALFEVARVLEGVVRNVGKHAGGIVIAPRALLNYTPLMLDAEEKQFLTQFDKDDLEKIGLVKFDFLGLKTLTIIQEAVRAIQRVQQHDRPLLEIEKIPLNDKKAFELLCSGQTTAIFQIESQGMRQLVLKLLPDSFEEIIALVALYRPGPLQSGMVDNFINRKHGREACAYPDPDYQHELLRPILSETYGIILYQEQAMQIAQVLSGYSLSEADLLRRVIGKKKVSEMLQQRERFAQGAQKKGISPGLSKKIFDLVEKFSGYAFNKSHSTAYALITYQMLYLKAHFPEYFMAAVLSADLEQTDKLAEMLAEARRMQIKVARPNINQSSAEFSVSQPNTIEFGLCAIKGLGSRSVETIIREREKGGKFKSFEDFLRRVATQEVGKAAIEKLIMAGAFDALDSNRGELFAELPKLIAWIESSAKASAAGQQGLFGNLDAIKEAAQQRAIEFDTSIKTQRWTIFETLQQEYQALGYYFSGNPLCIFEQEFLFHKIKTNLAGLGSTSPRGEPVKIALLVQKIKFKRTKRGESFALLSGVTSQEKIEIIVPFSALEPAKSFCQVDALIIVEGNIKREVGAEHPRIFAQRLEDWNRLRQKEICGLNFEFFASANLSSGQMIHEFKHLFLKQFGSGKVPCYLTIPYSLGQAVWALPEKFNLALDLKALKSFAAQLNFLKKIELKYPSGWVLFECSFEGSHHTAIKR